MSSEHETIRELCAAVLVAAQRVAEPIQQSLAEKAIRDQQIKWFGAAFESLSFYLVIATRVAQVHGVTRAQLMANALYRAILPEIAARFFSRNPHAAQQQMLESFQAGHYNAETAYGRCQKLLPEGHEPDPDSLVSCFAYKLLAIAGDARPPAVVLSSIFRAVQDPEGLPKIFSLVQAACAVLPGDPAC